jgi:flagellar biosynthesis protein FliQ
VNPDTLPALFREGLMLLAMTGAPLFGALLIVGLTVGILQSATQVQEPAVGAVPRLATVGVMVALLGPWMMDRLAHFLRQAMEHLAERPF